jgi:murein DD-endopeptidase MepM/ murein hydrolase activator NlpD
MTFYLNAQIDNNLKFNPPLEIPLIISANFGELRPNHFHMGLDFKTNGKEGVKILAIEDGYVSRIKISPYGYGKVVYINHPNGITSVYAHCSFLLGKLDSIVKITQEKDSNFEIEIFPNKDEISVKKGENFALSGNSGSSTAPHLHFELRDTKTETALNPLKFGFDIIDQKPPEIKYLKIYGVTKEGYRINGKSKKIPVNKGKFGHYINGDIISIPSDIRAPEGGIGLSFEVIDYYNQAINPLGIYKSFLVVNMDTIFGQTIDSISFDQTKYINTHSDYEEFKINKQKFQKSFKTSDNPLSFYTTNNLGIIDIVPKDTFNIQYVAIDTKNNQSVLKFKLNMLDGEYCNPPLITSNFLCPNSNFNYTNEKISIQIPEGCLYEPTPKNIILKKEISISESKVPIQKPIKLSFKLDENKYSTEKYYLASNSSFLKTNHIDGWLKAESKSLGKFSIQIDTIKPSIEPLNFLKSDTIIDKKIMKWKISDEKSNI